MNPPYAAKLIPGFCKKIVKHYQEGNVEEAIVLVNNATDTIWFQTLLEHASAIVFPKGRVKYYNPSGKPGSPLQGQAVIYCGENPNSFIVEFNRFGIGTLLSQRRG